MQSIEDWDGSQFSFLEVLKLAHCKELTVIAGPMKFLGYILGSTLHFEGGSKAKYQELIAEGYKRFKDKYAIGLIKEVIDGKY